MAKPNYQAEYRRRKLETSEFLQFWAPKDVVAVVDRLRGDEPRHEWMNRAIMLEMVRHLLDRPVPFSDSDFVKAAKIGSGDV